MTRSEVQATGFDSTEAGLRCRLGRGRFGGSGARNRIGLGEQDERLLRLGEHWVESKVDGAATIHRRVAGEPERPERLEPVLDHAGLGHQERQTAKSRGTLAWVVGDCTGAWAKACSLNAVPVDLWLAFQRGTEAELRGMKTIVWAVRQATWKRSLLQIRGAHR